MNIGYQVKTSFNLAITKDFWLTGELYSENMTYNEYKLDYTSINSKVLNTTALMQFYFAQDENIQTIERKVYTVADALTNTGGMMGTVFGILGILVGAI